ncbi:MAG: ABC transporter substrate-binding protein [candidate division Zixibacteria bacterium]|nr:ABC transporter substrate-binding protein [candidate division Zixibacteria bacterium]
MFDTFIETIYLPAQEIDEMMKTLSALLLLSLALAAPVLSQDIEVDLLQVRMGRVYFAAGTEAGLAAGGSFTVVCGNSTVANGILEYAGPGISYSRPLPDLDSLKVTTGCRGRIAISGVDSTAIIRLGTELPPAMIDPEHETLLKPDNDSLTANLADSIRIDGKSLRIFLPPNIRFAGGGQLDAATLVWWLKDIRQNSSSSLARFFFSKLLPSDSGGIEAEGNFVVRLTFFYPFPEAAWFFSHPDFAVYDIRGRGTGPLVLLESQSNGQKSYIPNANFRGQKPRFSKVIVAGYDQPSRMREDFGRKLIDGYIGFGFNDGNDAAGRITARFPFIAAMVPSIGATTGSAKEFATALYAAFDPDRAHLYFPSGVALTANRWTAAGADSTDIGRLIPFDIARAQALASVLPAPSSPIKIAYDDRHLMETAGFLSDIASGMSIPTAIERSTPDIRPDIRLTFVSAPDCEFPFGLVGIVMNLNDQNGILPLDRRVENPAWRETDLACRSGLAIDGENAFAQVDKKLFADFGAFPLFRPSIEIVTDASLKNGRFDRYGYPVLESLIKLRKTR